MEKYAGWGSGFTGMLIFSGSLPATRLAVESLDPLFVTAARGALAALLGLAVLVILRQARPGRAELVSLTIVALGAVIGFPLLTGLALQQASSAYATIYIGLLPLATAIFGVWRAKERPSRGFWVFSALGAAAVAGYAAWDSGAAGPWQADICMLAAILVCGWAYAEGAVLSRTLGGWQVISWALVLSLPVTGLIALSTLPSGWGEVDGSALAGLAYVTVFSMLVGFVFWYRGLARGGVAGVGQLQLLQPFFALVIAALILGEAVTIGMASTALLVVLCVAGAKRFA